MNDHIKEFLQQQTCATVCCIDEYQKPWCFTCFYTFNSNDGLLYYKSSAGSSHSAIMKENPVVAGSVLPDKLNKLIVQGIQFEGVVLDPEHPLSERAAAYYYKSSPLALAVSGEIWTIQINHIKMTDSKLGFGKKITWHREDELVCHN